MYKMDAQLTELLKTLLEEKQQREIEVTEQRTQREEERRAREAELTEERRVREAELKEERRLREEEASRRQRETKDQLKLFQRLIEGLDKQATAAATREEKNRDVKVAKLTDDDDIEAYLTTFERLIVAYEIPQRRWAFKLASQLVGKAQQAYAAMSTEDSANYTQLKQAILRRYNITEESYRQRFRFLKKESGETNRELATRLTDLAGKWLKKCDTLDKLKDAIVCEQLINTLPTDVQVWVRERKPKTSQEAGQLADDYVQARKQTNESVDQPWSARKPGDKKSIRCYKCKKLGHIAKECHGSSEPPEDTDRTTTEPRVAGSTMSGGVNDEKPKKSMSKDWSKIECFNCHQKGHYSSHCPSNSMFCGEKTR